MASQGIKPLKAVAHAGQDVQALRAGKQIPSLLVVVNCTQSGDTLAAERVLTKRFTVITLLGHIAALTLRFHIYVA